MLRAPFSEGFTLFEKSCRGDRTTFLTIEVLPFYDPPAGHFDKRVAPRYPSSLYREADWSDIDQTMDRGVEVDPLAGFSDALSSVRAVLEETHLSGTGHRLGAAASPQLAVEVVNVGLDRAHRDEELTVDLIVGIAGSDEREHLELPLA